MTLEVIVLAAGQGKRMNSDLPKVLHPLAGRPLLAHVLNTARQLTPNPVAVVVGHGGEAVRAAFPDQGVNWVTQHRQQGTGHAVSQALGVIAADSQALVLYGDVPLIRPETLQELLSLVSERTLAVLTVRLDNPTGYGRILRDGAGRVVAIVEERDASEEQRAITEVNTGVMAFPPGFLHQWLPTLGNDNAQGEYYLTDLVGIAVAQGFQVAAHTADCALETEGVNSRRQLHDLERLYQRRLAQDLLDQGVAIADTGRFDCRGELTCGRDCVVDVNAVFEGRVVLGSGVHIGANCLIRDAEIGDGAVIKANTVIEGPVQVGQGVEVGPFARLRPGTRLDTGSRVGNFVETKKSVIGPGSKVNHLSYVGDTVVGRDANVGAGTITCNYDGVNKHRTHIGDGAFIGSNSSLVAPVTVGDRATVGAGSTITEDVGDDQLAVGRGRQRNIDNWQRPLSHKTKE